MINIISVFIQFVPIYCYTFVTHDFCDPNRVSFSRLEWRILEHCEWCDGWVHEGVDWGVSVCG